MCAFMKYFNLTQEINMTQRINKRIIINYSKVSTNWKYAKLYLQGVNKPNCFHKELNPKPHVLKPKAIPTELQMFLTICYLILCVSLKSPDDWLNDVYFYEFFFNLTHWNNKQKIYKTFKSFHKREVCKTILARSEYKQKLWGIEPQYSYFEVRSYTNLAT